jgi:hydrogenase maturation protein HypF
VTKIDTVRLRIAGRVQGVGFRPFVYRLAQVHRLAGRVRNLTGAVEIDVQGRPEDIDGFRDLLLIASPPLARPRLESQQILSAPAFNDFRIEDSDADALADIHVPPDSFLCDDCLRELFDPADRRYRYPFINCTQCGPRYTLIAALPYDRANTSMAGFGMCPACAGEYRDPRDRRFHAEPVACAACGPVLSYEGGDGGASGNEAALGRALAILREGRVLAVKGIGGYHLMCDARNERAVLRLRERKHRPDKPLAVMFPQHGADGLGQVRTFLNPTEEQVRALFDPARPIVLVGQREDSTLARSVAPGLGEVGAFLPYSPLHHLLLHDFGGPLVATSGNLSGEPVLTEIEQARERLSTVADAFLHHDRPILRPADDSVYRAIGARCRPRRLGRGLAPLELPLPRALPGPSLAVGGHLKVTVALAWADRVVVSPHISDLGTVRGQ